MKLKHFMFCKIYKPSPIYLITNVNQNDFGFT